MDDTAQDSTAIMEGHPAGVGDDEFGDPHDMEGDVDGFGNKAF